MLSDAKLDNYKLFCQMAESYGVCDRLSGDDKHKRVHMGVEEGSGTRYYGQLRKDYMKVYYSSRDKVDIEVTGGSALNVPVDNSQYDYYSDIMPADYDAFLSFVSRRLGRQSRMMAQGINYPMEPKRIIQGDDGSVNYQCPTCDLMFKQAERCPECGQLIKR